MPINESAIAAAAYAAGHNRSKDCPLLGQIAHGALMEFLASKAQGSIASGPYPSNEVVMGKRVAEGQSGDRESKKNTDTMNDESNIRTNALGDLKPYVSPSQSVLQGVEENEVEIPVEDHHENRAESKISSSGVKTEDYEAKILENGQPELKIAADVRYPHDEENNVVKDPKEEVQNATISIEGVHAGKMEDLKDMEVKDLMEDENYDGVEVFQICEGAGANSSSESFQMINDNAHDILKNSDTDKEKTSTATTNISVLILHIAATALQSNNENELPRRFDKCSTSSHAVDVTQESMDHNQIAEKNSASITKQSSQSTMKPFSVMNKDEGKLRAEGSIRGHFDELNSEAEEVKGKQFKESNDAESWRTTTSTKDTEIGGNTCFEDPEFWGTTTSSKYAETWRTTSFKDPGSWGSASSIMNHDVPWNETMKSKVWHPFKYSEYPGLNEIMVF